MSAPTDLEVRRAFSEYRQKVGRYNLTSEEVAAIRKRLASKPPVRFRPKPR